MNFGWLEVEEECPEPKDGEVRVRVLAAGVSGFELGQVVAALPISSAYAEFACLPQRELVAIPSGLNAAEAVSLVLNCITAYQMMYRAAHVKPGQRVLIHAAAGGVGSALLQIAPRRPRDVRHLFIIKGAGRFRPWRYPN